MAQQKFQSNLPPWLEQIYRQSVQGGGIANNPLYQAGGSYLQGLLSNEPGAFQAFEQPYMRQFEQQTVPGLANQFASYGTGAGGLKGSGFYGALSSAGAGLSQDLASLRESLRMQAAQSAPGYASSPLQQMMQLLEMNPYSQVAPQQNNWLSPLLTGVGTAAGTFFGGPAGGAAGAGLGSLLGGLFQKGQSGGFAGRY